MATLNNLEQYRYRFFRDKARRLFQCIDTGIDYEKADKPEIVSLRELEKKTITHVLSKEFEAYIQNKNLVETEVRAK